jgi:non-specific serine/threonine protein kinase
MIDKTISHYKILEKLGGGGMGVVYEAEDTKLKRTVALKFLPPAFSLDEEAKKRFINEAQAASSFDHPNICTIYEINETDDGQLFIAMAFYQGETLKKKIDRGAIPIDEVISIISQVAQGLSRAQENGIIHRDIKPANIFITNRNEVKILDFGLAKISGQNKITQMGTTSGTVAYMSPEQTKGEEVDHRTDIWSLGVVLYQMLSGSLPFQGDYDQAIIYSILNEEPSSLNSLPAELENILNMALQKNPGDRYDNLNEMLDDLKKLIRNDTHQTTVDKPGRKRKQQAIIVSSIVGLILAFIVVYFVFIYDSGSGESSVERKMLVVLPFKNLGLLEDEYFADGITEEITSRLSEIKQIGVIGRTSADQYKNTEKSFDQIGDELGVDYLLEGSVRWEKLPGKESRIRVTPQLINVSDGTHLWTKRYDAILESVFDLQSDIAEKVAKALDITLLGAKQKSISQKPTDNLEAYDYFLRGNTYYFQRSLSEDNSVVAEKLYLKAVGLDSNFVLPYIRLAQLNLDYYWFHWDRNKIRLTKAKYYLDKALEINPNIPELYVALGHYYYAGFLDYDKALFELENGLKIYPDNGEILEFIGAIKRRQGKFEEAISYFKRSVKPNPLSYYNLDIGETYLLLKKYEEAEKYLEILISSIPEWGIPYCYKAKLHIFRDGDVNRAYQILKGSLDVVNQEKMWVTFLLVQIRILEGKYEEALKMLSDEPANVFENQFTFLPKPQIMATIYRLQNKNDLAKDYYDSASVVIEEKLKELPDDTRLYSALGLVLAGLGKKNEAIKEGKRATELLPITKEAWRGFFRELDLARIYTMVGEYDLAIDKLEYLLSIPGELSVPYIKLDPVWQPLLKIPRFQNVLEQYK